MKGINYFHWLIIFILNFVSIGSVQAHQGRGKFWLGINAQQNFCRKEKWLWSINSQIRFTKQRHPFNSLIVEPLLGYQLNDCSIWLGYRFTRHFFNKPSYNENRLIQQLIYRSDSKIHWNFRSRLEERYRSNHKQLNLRFRQRIAMEIPLLVCNKINPFIYKELFLMMNKTNYTSHKFISEDRLFLGINYYIHKDAWWEIGYMLQYLAKTPQNNSFQLDHILSINYNFR